MRISDWSSDVCSSDLRSMTERLTGSRSLMMLQLIDIVLVYGERKYGECERNNGSQLNEQCDQYGVNRGAVPRRDCERKIGRASCRERVCKYVEISVVAVS